MQLDLIRGGRRVRVVVVDHEVTRTAASALLESKLVEVVGYADSVEQATLEAWRLGPDVLVVDLRMPAGEHLNVFSAHPASNANRLSPQERRVLEQVAKGMTNKQIGRALGISDKTVKNYLSNAYQKLSVTRRIQAVAALKQQDAGDATENPTPPEKLKRAIGQVVLAFGATLTMAAGRAADLAATVDFLEAFAQV